jgi:hypothetical protein
VVSSISSTWFSLVQSRSDHVGPMWFEQDTPTRGVPGNVTQENGAAEVIDLEASPDGAPPSKPVAAERPLQNGVIKAGHVGANADRQSVEGKETSAPVLRSNRSLSGMRGPGGKGIKTLTSGNNPLANAWREDFDLGKIVLEAQEIFGDKIAPWLPAEHLSQIML